MRCQRHPLRLTAPCHEDQRDAHHDRGKKQRFDRRIADIGPGQSRSEHHRAHEGRSARPVPSGQHEARPEPNGQHRQQVVRPKDRMLQPVDTPFASQWPVRAGTRLASSARRPATPSFFIAIPPSADLDLGQFLAVGAHHTRRKGREGSRPCSARRISTGSSGRSSLVPISATSNEPMLAMCQDGTRHRWNKGHAAVERGLSRVGLRAKLDSYGIADPSGRVQRGGTCHTCGLRRPGNFGIGYATGRRQVPEVEGCACGSVMVGGAVGRPCVGLRGASAPDAGCPGSGPRPPRRAGLGPGRPCVGAERLCDQGGAGGLVGRDGPAPVPRGGGALRAFGA